MNRQILALTASAALVLGACGGDDGGADDASSATAGPGAGVATTTAASPASTVGDGAASGSSTSGASTSTTAATASTSATGAGATAPTAVRLVEWEVEAPGAYTAGPVSFEVTNGGEAPHELLVIEGSYESLPRSDTGAVLEDQLPAGAILGETERLEPGSSATLSVDLASGSYVLLCNISIGPNSHAGKGQRLDVTVS